MLLTSWELLIEHPEIRKHFKDIYKFVIIDEFQDVNTVQYEIDKNILLLCL